MATFKVTKPIRNNTPEGFFYLYLIILEHDNGELEVVNTYASKELADEACALYNARKLLVFRPKEAEPTLVATPTTPEEA